MGTLLKIILILVIFIGVGYLFYHFLADDYTKRRFAELLNPATVKYTVDQTQCKEDSDCIPELICHPRECISSIYADQLRAKDPDIGLRQCSLEYYSWEASDESCKCNRGRCTNVND